MTAVATKPRAKATLSTPQAKLSGPISTPIEAPQFFWLAPTKLALQALFDLIDTAVDLDLPENDTSNYACRVIQVARDLILKEVESTDLAARSMARNEIANVAFDVFALLTAALNYPDEPLGVTRISLVKHACAIADRLADFHCHGIEAGDPRGAEALPGLQRAIEVAPTQSEAQPPAPPRPPKDVEAGSDAGKPVDEACGHYQHALAVVEAAVVQVAHDQERSALVYAARNLMRRDLGPLFDALTSAPDDDALNNASAALSVVVGLLEAAAFANDDSCLWGAHTLAGLSKTALDEHIREVERSGAAS